MKNQGSKSERTRQFIVERTAPIFNAKGFAGTSLSDLTDATGLSKGSIYGNFENKDEVALAAFDFNFGRVTQFLKEQILSKENAIERLLVYPDTYRNFMKIPFLQAGCPLLNTSTEADDTHPLLKERAAKALDFWKASLENQVKRGIERGEIATNTQPSLVAVVIMSMLEGAVMQAKVCSRSTELQMAMDFLANYLRSLKS